MYSTGLCLKLFLSNNSKDDFFFKKWRRKENSPAVLAHRM